jgi:hypothetical protein
MESEFASLSRLANSRRSAARDSSRQAPHVPFVLDLAFPDYLHVPAEFAQRRSRSGVSCDVTTELLEPEPAPCLRNRCPRTAFVTVPKAAVHEDHGAPSRQNDVRRPGQSNPMDTKPQALTVQITADNQFRSGVTGSDSRHDCATTIRVEYIQLANHPRHGPYPLIMIHL